MSKHRPHRFIGQEEGDRIALWLNKNWGTPAWRRVIEILLGLQAMNSDARNPIEELLRSKQEEFAKSGRIVVSLADLGAVRHAGLDFFISNTPETRQHTARVRKLDRLLSHCWMRPRIVKQSVTLFGSGKAHKKTDPPRRVRAGVEWLYQDDVARIAHLLVKLSELGLVESLRRCKYEKCREWLFAKQPGHFYCPPAEGKRCQQAAFDSDIQAKEQRKARRAQNRQYAKLKSATNPT